jgi:hypothetical protein
MTIKQAAKKLEKFLEDVDDIMPLTLLSDGNVAYKNYVIEKNKDATWTLSRIQNQSKIFIEVFNLKSSTLLAAKQHRHDQIMDLHRICDLDQRYWSNHTDSVHFKERYKHTKDEVKRDIFLWRYEQTRDRADYYKKEITQAFNQAFR